MLSKKLIASLAALGAVAAGGVASAATNPTTAPATTAPAAVVQVQTPAPKAADVAEPTGGVDTDTLQEGDQTTPDTGTGATDTETADANEPAGQESGSEKAGNDGPGGHADEPGNANADHQAEGAE